MASTRLERISSMVAGSTTKATVSAWVKRSGIGTDGDVYFIRADNSNYGRIRIRSDDRIEFIVVLSNSTLINKRSNRLLRDCSGWYHIVLAIDLTLSTEEDKIKLYINNERITSWLSNTNTSATSGDWVGGDGNWNPNIGGGYGVGAFFDGSMSFVSFVDGQALTPSTFGETDSDTGQWKIKTDIVPGGTGWGTNGYLILKNGNSLTDESTNTNNFQVLAGGTLTNTLDCPDNVFATINFLDNYYFSGTFSNGNNTVITNTSLKAWSTSTIGMTSGKYYYEAKNSATGGSAPSDPWNRIGITDRSATSNSDIGTTANQYVITQYDGSKYVNGTNSTYAAAWVTGDIIGCAIDLDNNKIYWHKNGQWGTGSGAWGSTTFNSSTGAVTLVSSANTINGFYLVGVGDAGGSVSKTWQFNFGNGYFGTTAVTSAGTAGSTPGTFEYDVPSGFQPLSTKGLNA